MMTKFQKAVANHHPAEPQLQVLQLQVQGLQVQALWAVRYL
jgi:hypothetical protein